MSRPIGSKSKKRDGYARRTKEMRERYGEDVFRKWGKKGGNPMLLKVHHKKKKGSSRSGK